MTRLNRRDKSVCYASLKIGEYEDGRVVYGKPFKFYGQLNTPISGSVVVNDYGDAVMYSTILLVECNKLTENFDKFTKFWIDSEPVAEITSYDYEVVSIGRTIDGITPIYLKSHTRNYNQIWFEYDDKILALPIDFDFDRLVGAVPINTFIAMNKNTKVWTDKPINGEETDGLIKLVEIKTLPQVKTLHFEKVNEKNG